MANEAVLRKLVPANGIRSATVADGTALTIGALLVAPETAATVHADQNEGFLGVLLQSKAANDGRVSVRYAAAGSGAEFQFASTGTVNAGDAVVLSDTANTVQAVESASLSGARLRGYVGKAVTAAASNLVNVVMD